MRNVLELADPLTVRFFLEHTRHGLVFTCLTGAKCWISEPILEAFSVLPRDIEFAVADFKHLVSLGYAVGIDAVVLARSGAEPQALQVLNPDPLLRLIEVLDPRGTHTRSAQAADGAAQYFKRAASRAWVGDAATDHLSELGLEVGATRDEITRAYRERILEVHPDRVQQAVMANGLWSGFVDVANEKAVRLNLARDKALAALDN